MEAGFRARKGHGLGRDETHIQFQLHPLLGVSLGRFINLGAFQFLNLKNGV